MTEHYEEQCSNTIKMQQFYHQAEIQHTLDQTQEWLQQLHQELEAANKRTEQTNQQVQQARERIRQLEEEKQQFLVWSKGQNTEVQQLQ